MCAIWENDGQPLNRARAEMQGEVSYCAWKV
jgi:hypothetical protein